MSYDLHAFISYAHIDNEPLTPGDKGWVTQFHATLQTMLSQRLGEKARIWRDDKLGGNDIFAAEIVDQFSKTALLVSVLTPRYLRSEWCTRELREFCETAARSGGVTVGNKSRVFKIVKTPVEADTPLPPPVDRMLGYEFFSLDNGEPKELDPAFGDALRQQFLTRLSALAWDMAKSLQTLASNAPPAVDAQPGKPVVFLADCGRDLHAAREQLATDLRMHGYEVLPPEQLPMTEEALIPALQAQLARAALSIHCVGASLGPIPDGPSGRSLVMIENDVAGARSRQAGLQRIIWIPDAVESERPEQQAFLKALQQDAGAQVGADLLRGDLEALKAAVHGTLQRLEKPAPARASAATDKPLAHVLMTEPDRPAAVPLLKLLRAHGVDVTIPVFQGDAAALREANAQLLSGCDAVILFYGAGDEVWKFHQLSDLRKHGTAADRKRSSWVCLAAPLTPDKDMLRQLGDSDLLDALDGFSEERLAPLLSALQAATSGR